MVGMEAVVLVPAASGAQGTSAGEDLFPACPCALLPARALVRLVSCPGHFLFAGASGCMWLGTPALPKPILWAWEPRLMEGSHPGWSVINCNDRSSGPES